MNSPFNVRLDMWRLALYLLLTLCGVMYSGAMKGGTLVPIHDYPYVVYISGIKLKKATTHSGILITPRHVLTNAHFFRFNLTTNMDAKKLKLIAGASTVGSAYIDEWSWGHDIQIRRAQRLLLHEDFRAFDTKLTNNIAIVTVTHEFYMTRAVQLASLPTVKEAEGAYNRKRINVTGYGWLKWNASTNKHLNTIQIIVVEVDLCLKIMAHRKGVHVHNDQNFCGYEAKKPRILAACFGDEGGPAVLFSTGIVIGYVHWSICAASIPSVFMRIDFFLDWIKKNTIIT